MTIADLETEIEALTGRVQKLEADAKAKAAAPAQAAPGAAGEGPDASDLKEFADKFLMFGPSRSPKPAGEHAGATGATGATGPTPPPPPPNPAQPNPAPR